MSSFRVFLSFITFIFTLFKGTSVSQDARFGDKQKKLLKEMYFPKCFDNKVDIEKVSLIHIQKWVAEKLKKILEAEDEILLNYVMTQLEEKV